MFNVLLSCAGRRNYLIGYFRQALAGRGRICAVDASPHAAALQEADTSFLAPTHADPDYLDAMLRLCRDNDIRMLISLNDLELPILARHKDRFLAQGTLPVVSSAAVIDLCLDKWATATFLPSIGLKAPRTWLSLLDAHAAVRAGELAFPMIVKPRFGSASVGVFHARSQAELDALWQLCALQHNQSAHLSASVGPHETVLVQEMLHGQEHGLDVINDLNGNHAATFGKRKLAMRAGETDRAVTVHDPRFEKIGRRLSETLKHVGNLDCDVFVDNDECHVLELNPRFGGGYPFSHLAGANLPAALVAWAMGEIPSPDWLAVRPDVIGAKCDRVVAINPLSNRSI